MSEPVARGCGAGKHWSSAGGTSHCVEDDRYCDDGTLAKRDALDNLYCEADLARTEGNQAVEPPPKNNEPVVQEKVKR